MTDRWKMEHGDFVWFDFIDAIRELQKARNMKLMSDDSKEGKRIVARIDNALDVLYGIASDMIAERAEFGERRYDN